MKNALIIIALLLSISTFGQSNMLLLNTNIKQETELFLIEKELIGQIEFDGHVFENKKSSDPVMFRASLSGVEIMDSKRHYQYRKCDKEHCVITHLTDRTSGFIFGGGLMGTTTNLTN